MLDNEDKAMLVLEKAIAKAQVSLEETKFFKPFMIILNSDGELEFFENELVDNTNSYEALEKKAKELICNVDMDVIVIAVDTAIPENFAKGTPQSIRLHVEEKCRIDKKIGARYIYVPYELYQLENEKLEVRLQNPIAIAFPAEYIV